MSGREVLEAGGNPLAAALEQLTDAVVGIDAQGRVAVFNRAAERLLGCRRAEILGRAAAERLPAVSAILASAGATAHELAIGLPDGRSLKIEALTSRLSFGGADLVLATLRDISGAAAIRDEPGLPELVSNGAEVRQMQELQRDVLQALTDELPLKTVIELICARVEKVAPEMVCSIHLIDEERRLRLLAAPSLPAPIANLLEGLSIGAGAGVCGMAAFWGDPVIVEDMSDNPLCAELREPALAHGLAACWSSPIKTKDGKVVGTLAAYYREKRRPSAWHEQIVASCVHLAMLAIERHMSREHIARLAYHDALTGLPNRRRLRERFRERIGQLDGRGRFAFLVLDLDRFKDINDTLGHATGDRLLIEIGRRLARLLGPEDMFGRYGGDEFIMLLAGHDAAAARDFCIRALEQLKAPMVIGDMLLPVSASIGVGIYPDDGANEETLFKHADTAMYEAKSAGGGTFRFFRPEMNRLAQERLVLGAALREAIDRRQLQLSYQPQVDCHSGALVGAEALARWRHPVLGQVSPARFVPLAEELGLIEQIGNWALEEACRQLAAWRRSGLMLDGVSVNLSALHFRNPGLSGFIAETLSRYGVAPGMLTVEITEGVIMDTDPAAIETAKAVHALGVKLSLDDFGTGYSSLSYLARLPIDELKIDRGFMRDLEHDKNAQAVATAVVRIGQSLALRVVAEGVETVAQHGFIDGLGCDLVQGFLVSRPLAPEEFAAWCRNYRPQPLMRLSGAA